jgi:exopolysaccharide production protein ExoY
MNLVCGDKQMSGTSHQAVGYLLSDYDEQLVFLGRDADQKLQRRSDAFSPPPSRADAAALTLAAAAPEGRSRGGAGFRWTEPARGTPVKRCFDFVATIAILVLVAPLMVAVFLTLRLFEKGPAFYSQARVGQFGRTIPVFKFRTMVADAEAILQTYLDAHPDAAREWAAVRKLAKDPRITPIGAFLRKTSIDELPQLFNVLRGEMSLVGPRPVIADDLERYGLEAIHYLRQRPGITGLWQVSGRSRTTYAQRVGFDRAYNLHRTFLIDLKILFRTIPAVLQADGAV